MEVRKSKRKNNQKKTQLGRHNSENVRFELAPTENEKP